MARIAFRYNDTRIFARLVCLWRGGDSAHCEVAEWCALPDSPNTHICVSSSWLDGGVRIKNIELTPNKWRIYEVPITYASVSDWASAHVGSPYDWAGLLGLVIPRIRGRKKAYFCSEAGAEIMGLEEPNKFDLRLLEIVCKRYGKRVQ